METWSGARYYFFNLFAARLLCLRASHKSRSLARSLSLPTSCSAKAPPSRPLESWAAIKEEKKGAAKYRLPFVDLSRLDSTREEEAKIDLRLEPDNLVLARNFSPR